MSEGKNHHEDWLTIGELARRWRVGYDTVRRMVLERELPSMPVRGVRRISRHLIEEIEKPAKSIGVKGILREKERISRRLKYGKDHYADC